QNSSFDFDSGTGGGIFNDTGSTANVSNCTIWENSAGCLGIGGILNNGIANIKSTLFFNYGGDAQGSFQSTGYNLVSNADGSMGFTNPTDITGTSASPIDPKLDILQDNGGPTETVALLPGSPAVDKGTSVGLFGSILTDQRGTGFPRTIDDP